MINRVKLRMIGIIILLFSISLFPEIVNLDFTIELRSLVFAAGVSAIICFLIKNIVIIGKTKYELASIDIAFITVTILTVISFVTKTESIYAFHYAFVQVGMAVVYFAIRFANSDKILLQSKIIYSVVGIGFIVAMTGLVQFVMDKPVVSTFGRTSYLGCFLAMNIPLAFGLVLATMGNPSFGIRYLRSTRRISGGVQFPTCAGRYRVFGIRCWGCLFSVAAFIVILGVVILTKSRTALIAMAVVLPIIVFATKTRRLKEKKKSVEKKELKTKLYKRKSVKLLLCLGVLVATLLLFVGGKAVYKIRPMSASGRVLIWKVSAEMFRKNPISGVGFGNFANYYNLYQAEYFASGKGSVINKMTAGQVRHAYNWYLETAVEFGVFGLIVFGMFWWLIVVEIYKTIVPRKTRNARKESETEYRTPDTEYFLNMGMAGAVLCFMIMSLFQFSRMIIPTYLLFNVALAWIVNANKKTDADYTNLHEIKFIN